jgi:hypothetical protein
MPDIVKEAIKSQEKKILELNFEDQLYQMGVLSTGSSIIPYYAESTIKKKIRKGQRYDHVTLRDTKKFHESFRVTYEADDFRIVSDDHKKVFLEKRYSEYIYGLTDDSQEILKEGIKEYMLNQIQTLIR